MESSLERGAVEQDEQQRAVFDVLMDAHPSQITLAELVTAIGSEPDALDGLRPLMELGIVHQRGDCVWPSRTAARLAFLIGGVLE